MEATKPETPERVKTQINSQNTLMKLGKDKKAEYQVKKENNAQTGKGIHSKYIQSQKMKKAEQTKKNLKNKIIKIKTQPTTVRRTNNGIKKQ